MANTPTSSGSYPNGNGNTSLAGLPVYARVIVQVLFQYGVPAGIAVFLVWMLAVSNRADIRANTVALQDVKANQVEVINLLKRMDTRGEANEQRLRNLCLQGAKTADDIRACAK